MKKPEEIKKGLECCNQKCVGDKFCPYDEYSNACENTLHKDALAYIQQLEAQVPRWIPVDERLPEIAEHRGKYDVSVRVLCACLQKSGRRMVKEGYFEIFDGKYFDWRIPGTIDKVTHWIPMPEAPKEDAK